MVLISGLNLLFQFFQFLSQPYSIVTWPIQLGRGVSFKGEGSASTRQRGQLQLGRGVSFNQGEGSASRGRGQLHLGRGVSFNQGEGSASTRGRGQLQLGRGVSFNQGDGSASGSSNLNFKESKYKEVPHFPPQAPFLYLWRKNYQDGFSKFQGQTFFARGSLIISILPPPLQVLVSTPDCVTVNCSILLLPIRLTYFK